MKKRNNILTILIMISVIYLIVSLTYSYFDVEYKNIEDSTTVGISSGEVSITFDGGPELVSDNIDQGTSPIMEKEFTVTGRNTSSSVDELNYSASIRVTKNTFTDNALSYTLSGTGSNGNRIPNNSTRKGIKSGPNNTLLGNGKFTGNVSGQTHSYTLKIYFHPNDSNYAENMGKDFSAYIVVGEQLFIESHIQVNKPQLTEGLTPIKFDGFSEKTTHKDDPDWYSYHKGEKMWANAKTNDGSYWVWIPRYAYKIASCYHMNASSCESETGKEAGDIEILFLDGTKDKTFDGTSVSLTPSYSGSSQTNYVKHPAFTFGNDEIEGFWVSKFEVSGTTSNLSSKPNVASLRSTEISDMFTASLNMKDDSKFGWNSSKVDTHMLKNIEWGAVAYLAQSIYGSNEEVYINNSSSYTTGCSGDTVSASSQSGCANAWNTENGTKASTTHNITGVYDMSGGAWEYVAAYSDTGHLNIETYGSSLKTSYETHGTKYVDYYQPDGDNIYKPNYFGDAMYETSSSGSGSNSWYRDFSYTTTNSSVFLPRGGLYNSGTNAGLFSFNRTGGSLSAGWRVSVASIN